MQAGAAGSPGDARPVPTRSRRRSTLVAFAVPVTAGAIAVVLVVAVFTVGGGILTYTICLTGPDIGTSTAWTPLLVVNAPQYGYASGWSNGSLYLGNASAGVRLNLSDGAAGVVMAPLTWTFYLSSNATLSGWGKDAPCAQNYQASVLPNGSPATCILQGPSNESDANVSVTTPVPSCPFLGSNSAARFPDNYLAPTCPPPQSSADYCAVYGYPPEGWGIGDFATHYPVSVPLTRSGSTDWFRLAVPQLMQVDYFSTAPGCWQPQILDGVYPGANGWITWGPYAANLTAAQCTASW